MELKAFIAAMNSGTEIEAQSPVHLKMHALSQEALRITAQINGSYHDQAQLKALMQELTDGGCGEDFGLFPPFYTDCGKNTKLGKGVFIKTVGHLGTGQKYH